MSDIIMIEDTARRTIADALTAQVIEAAEQGTWASALWARLETQGLLQPSAMSEGGDTAEGLQIEAAVLRAAAATALPLPIAETALAGWFLAQQGIEAPAGPLSVASFAEDDALSFQSGQVSGSLARVPWGRNAVGVVAIANGTFLLLDPRSAKTTCGVNMAAEPRDTIAFNQATPLAVGGTADKEQMLWTASSTAARAAS